MLEITWAVIKFLAGLPHFDIIIDHNSLLSILNCRLGEIKNPRLQCLRTTLMAYHFTAHWQKEALHSTPDAFSRNPVCDPARPDQLSEEPVRSPCQLAAILQRSELRVNLLFMYVMLL